MALARIAKVYVGRSERRAHADLASKRREDARKKEKPAYASSSTNHGGDTKDSMYNYLSTGRW
jgi:hypothetical protein